MTAVEQRTILIADDEDDILEILESQIENLGHMVMKATSGREVLEAVDSGSRIDLIILDVKMPELDGLETLKAIRKRADVASMLPIIMHTGVGIQDVVHKATAYGVNDFLVKPSHKSELAKRLNANFPETIDPDLIRQEVKKSFVEDREMLSYTGIRGFARKGKYKAFPIVMNGERYAFLATQLNTKTLGKASDQTLAEKVIVFKSNKEKKKWEYCWPVWNAYTIPTMVEEDDEEDDDFGSALGL